MQHVAVCHGIVVSKRNILLQLPHYFPYPSAYFQIRKHHPKVHPFCYYILNRHARSDTHQRISIGSIVFFLSGACPCDGRNPQSKHQADSLGSRSKSIAYSQMDKSRTPHRHPIYADIPRRNETNSAGNYSKGNSFFSNTVSMGKSFSDPAYDSHAEHI